MIRMALMTALLALAACKEKPKPPPPNPIERGAVVFAPAADKLGEAVAVDLKSGNPDWYKDYLKQQGAKDESDLGRLLGKQILENFQKELAVTPDEEAAIKAGRFADAENLRRVRAAAAKYAETKEKIPQGDRVTMLKVDSGEWASGLQLEFAARVLARHRH